MARSPVYLPPEELERECRFETLRRSGPGGQNRNKVETGVRFYHIASGLVGEATEERYQAVNRRNALARLRLELALNARDLPENCSYDPDAPELPSVLRNRLRWFARLNAGKVEVAANHFDYAVMVAEFFDVYAFVNEDLKAAAAALGTTPSQIVKFLGKNQKALERLNSMRAKQGLPRLRP